MNFYSVVQKHLAHTGEATLSDLLTIKYAEMTKRGKLDVINQLVQMRYVVITDSNNFRLRLNNEEDEEA